MHRRKFLTLSLLSASSAVYATTGYGSLANPNDTYAIVKNYLTQVYCDLESAKTLGIKYLLGYPEKFMLTHLLSDMGFDVNPTMSINRASFIKKLTSQHEQDYIQGNMVTVEDWIVTRTEASSCAFLALCQWSH